MAIIIHENVVFKEINVEGNLKCPICDRTLIISGFFDPEIIGLDTVCLCYAYCISCDKYFKSVVNKKNEEK